MIMTTSGRRTVALIYGGIGKEREISIRSADRLFYDLLSVGASVFSTFIDPSGEWFMARCADFSPSVLSRDRFSLGKSVYPIRKGGCGGFIANGGFIAVDAAVPILHGDFGEDGRIQGALDTAGIPFVGCSCQVSAVCRDKSILKSILKGHGIPMLDWIEMPSCGSVESAISRTESALGYPVFVKPTSLGSSIGASAARDDVELVAAIRRAGAVSDRIMIERYLAPKRELECAFFEYKGKRYFTDPGQIRYKDGFYDFESKYGSSSDVSILSVADITDEQRESCRSLSRRIADILDLRHLSRIDFFLDDMGRLYFNEINTIPGLTAASLFPAMSEGAGVSLGELFLDLIDTASLQK